MIMDNALIAFEYMHAIRSSNNNGKSFDAYKLDLTKTYDGVNWVVLEGVRWIMEYSG
jgi:hypothetical protein